MADQETDRVKVTVLSIAGECAACHKVGQEIILDDLYVSDTLCQSAFYAMFPYITALKFKGKFPQSWGDQDAVIVACPDGTNLVRFEVRRMA